jgi:4-hydroxybenzoate polyprenyltransferase
MSTGIRHILRAVCHGSFMAMSYYVGSNQEISTRTTVGLLIVLLAVPVAGYLLNDLADCAEDAHLRRKLAVEGSRLWSTIAGVPMRRAERRGAWFFAITSCTVVFLFAVSGNKDQATAWLVYLFIGINYSTGVRLKARAPLDVFANGSIYAGPIVLGAVDASSTLGVSSTAVATAILVMALHGLHAVADLDSDIRDPNLNTIAVYLGTEPTVLLSVIALACVVHMELFTSKLANDHAWMVMVSMLITLSNVDTRTPEGRQKLGNAMVRGLTFIGMSFGTLWLLNHSSTTVVARTLDQLLDGDIFVLRP